MFAGLWLSGIAHADVRTENLKLAALIRDATGRCETFRALVAAIDGAKGIIYITPGRCDRVRACLLHKITIAGVHRVLTIVVDPQRDDTGLTAAIAHELQHAIEVLGDARITRDEEVFAFYRLRGLTVGGLFETWAAVEKADAVRRELRR
jgi:hypothetical protein